MSDPAAENMFKVRGKYQDGEFSPSKSKKIAVSMIVSSILAQCSIFTYRENVRKAHGFMTISSLKWVNLFSLAGKNISNEICPSDKNRSKVMKTEISCEIFLKF